MANLEHHADLRAADARLEQTVRAMTPGDFAADSMLPGWTRAHVLAHIALNAEGFSGVLEGVASGSPAPIYASDEVRDRDIDVVAASPADLPDRLTASASRLAAAVAALPADVMNDADTTVERVPGGMKFTLASLPSRRLAEVEIHHADLGLAYAAEHWPSSFLMSVLDGRGARHEGKPALVARALDLNREWRLGDPGAEDPTVEGSAADLAWWLIGRGTGSGLTSSTGTLPGGAGF